MDPLLIDVPERIDTERLVLRAPRGGDGQRVNDAIRVSHAELAPWMPWAGTMPSVDESEVHCRRQQARFILREDLVMLMFERSADGGEGELVGGSGLHRIDWSLRNFEIGYWRKAGCEGRGFVTEAVRALSRMAFDSLAARRVEIRMDDNNARAGASPSAPASRSRRCCASTRPRRRASRAARASTRACAAPRSRWAPACRPERSEGSRRREGEILRCAQDDRARSGRPRR